jgi:hypothetical protein
LELHHPFTEKMQLERDAPRQGAADASPRQSVMTRFDESHPAPLREYFRLAELQLRYCERMLSGDRTAGAEVDVLVPEIEQVWSSYIECKDRPASYSLQMNWSKKACYTNSSHVHIGQNSWQTGVYGWSLRAS